MSLRIFNNCSCLNSQGCPHPASFIDSDGNLILIQGMIADCLIMDEVLFSTFECYNNQTRSGILT